MTSLCSGDYLGFGWVVVGGEYLVILHTIIRTTLVKQQITELNNTVDSEQLYLDKLNNLVKLQ